jgi:hypothetical protein
VWPPPSPDPIHIKSYKLAVKECKWRLDAYVLPLAVWVLWYVVNPVSATPHSQLFFACVFGWVMFRWLCRHSVDVAQRMDWASNRLGKAAVPITLNAEQVVRQPAVHELEMHGDLLVQAVISGAFCTARLATRAFQLLCRTLCRLCWMIAWAWIMCWTLDCVEASPWASQVWSYLLIPVISPWVTKFCTTLTSWYHRDV